MTIIKWCSVHSQILYWCLLYTFRPTTSLQNETDRLVLISLRDAIQHDPFQVLSSWNDSLHFCNWYGISCSRRHPERVIALKLSSQGLVGTLSPDIGNLSFVRLIHLQNNSIFGKIPQEIGRLPRLRYLRLHNNSLEGNVPSNLSNCVNLIELFLMNNKLVGNIPAQLGSLPKLEALVLGRNNLTGNIPPSIGNLSSLQVLFLFENKLQGWIPQDLMQLRRIKYFILYENNLTGEIPYGLFNISNIEHFEVDFNRLNGSIPSEIGLTLPKLVSLVLAFNSFTGLIPATVSNASMLELIVFLNNNFTGLIPNDLGKLPYLQHVDFSSNQLQGDLSIISSLYNCSSLQVFGAASNFLIGFIPLTIGNLSKQMQHIDLSDNELQGTLPIGTQNLVTLQTLMLHENHLTGPIHINFKKFRQLQNLGLYNNEFTGNLPSMCGNSTVLSVLIMGFNNFNGSIPSSFGYCHSLIALDLSHNSLTGSIPPEILKLSSLSLYLDVSSNALTGLIPSEIGFLQNLVQLYATDNRLSGKIPNTIGSCFSLEELHLGGNWFEGEIPPGFGALRGLRELDISRNNLSGKIPDFLIQLHGLNHLNLSFNQLQGEVPKLGIFEDASAVSLLGNNGLCGGITELKLPSCSFTNPKKNELSLIEKVTIPVAVVAMFASFLACLSIFRNRRRVSTKNTMSSPSLDHNFLRISYAELFKATNGFSANNIIGVGSFGSVYKGILEQTGIQVAVKVLNLKQTGASNSFWSECQALRCIRHRNLLKLLSVCSSIDFDGNDFKALAYEFMVNGSLEKWLHAYRGGGEEGHEREPEYLKLISRLDIAVDIALAIDYLHNSTSSTIIHGDMKPSNVLLDEEMNAHIGDFGLSKIISSISCEIQQPQSSSIPIKGSIGYVAPEYGMGSRVSAEGDIYSLGILLLEMLTGKKPTDESFEDGLNLRNFVERCCPVRVIDIVDPDIIMFEDGAESFKDSIYGLARIGLACSMEVPAERMKIGDAIGELRKVKGSYMKAKKK